MGRTKVVALSGSMEVWVKAPGSCREHVTQHLQEGTLPEKHAERVE